ncbi:MAG: insulinase family protein [Clostridia bacterium]|nr:insulinase family protein [Clostridia bacterium]
MKKMLGILLSLCLLVGLVPAGLTQEAAAALPSVGDVVNGFEAVEIREFPLLGAQVVRFEHQRTGAELFYIANDDTNRVFDLTFFTEAIDNTGLPHVFEHSTLDGSEKYPSKALFFNLIYQTYNTYMNALTDQWMTTYPVASLSEAQLLKYADLYTDSCLHPMIMEDESIYREEAWRYRLADENAPLTIEGTVYSEMLGASTLQRAAMKNAVSVAFPGSMIGNESGGDPDFIPDMTWDMLKNYHDTYYHPSNCAVYLYGQFEDYTAFLKLLDDAFAPYEKKAFTRRSDTGYTPITEPVEAVFAHPVEAGSNTDHAAMAFYAIVCPGLAADAEQEMLLNTLTDLMTDGASALQQSLQKALPYGTFGSYIQTGAPEDAIVFYAMNINAEDAPVFKTTVDEALREIAQNGFPQDQVDGVMTSLKISTLLARETTGTDFVDNILVPIASSYSTSGRCWDYPDYVDAMGKMDEWNQQGLYAKAVEAWLVDSQTTALVTTYPQPGLKEENDAALAAKLADIKAAMSEEEIAAIVAQSNAQAEADDASQYVAQLQAVTVESLPEEVKTYAITDETDEKGVRHIEAAAGVDGIGQANIFLDATGLPQEDVHWFKLYTSLLGQLDTQAHTKAELATLMSRYFNDGRVNVSLVGKNDNFHPYLRTRWVALDEDLAASYDLVRELVFDTKVDDGQKLMEQVQGLKASLKSSITASPYNPLLYRALATVYPLYRYYSYVNYLEYYQFLEQVEQQLSEDAQPVTEKLQGIQAYFNNSANAVSLYAGSEESIALNRPLADAFLEKLNHAEITTVSYDFPVPAASEGLIVDSSVQYNLLVADYASLGLEDNDGGLSAVTSLVTDQLLMPLLRDQYGAYSIWHSTLTDDGVYIISYRDPNIDETFAVYDGLYDQVKAMEVDQDTLNGYILSSYASYAMASGELTGASDAALNVMMGEKQDRALEWMRQLKAVTPETLTQYAALYQKLSENGVRSTAGAASAINDHASLYQAILNPFGAKDYSQMTWSDVAEDMPSYEAVTFAIQNALMLPTSDDAFGTDQSATTGDLLAAMYALMGGSADAQAALPTFVQYGLVPEDTDLNAPVATADVFAIMSALVGENIPATTEQETLTRGEFAQVLMEFVQSLE